MPLFDFLMPEVAQASHLRQIADATSLTNTQSRLQNARMEKAEQNMNCRVQELESEIGQLTIVTEALLECLEEKGSVSKVDLAKKIGEIDARDGVTDGRITKEGPKRLSETTAARKLHIPK